MLNVTAIQAASAGFMTVFPCGTASPDRIEPELRGGTDDPQRGRGEDRRQRPRVHLHVRPPPTSWSTSTASRPDATHLTSTRRNVGTTGLEPGTSSVSWKRSNQLSYAPVAGRTLPVVTGATHLPLIDRGDRSSTVLAAMSRRSAREIDRACRDIGFFRITGHGVDPDLLGRLDTAAREFFAQPDDAKQAIAMANARLGVAGLVPGRRRADVGPARPQGGPLLRRRAPADHPRVRRRRAAARRQPVPAEPADLGPAVLRLARPSCDRVADAVMRGIALGLGLAADWFERPPHRRPDRAVPDLPLPARPTTVATGASPSTPTTACSRCSPRTTRGGLQVHAPRRLDRRAAPSPTCSSATSATCSTG